MYNHLKHTLQIVEEFNRVTLENAHVASETSTQATSHDGQGGGCQGVDAMEAVELVVSIGLSWNTLMKMRMGRL